MLQRLIIGFGWVNLAIDFFWNPARLYTPRSVADMGKTDEFKEYISSVAGALTLSQISHTENPVINSIIMSQKILEILAKEKRI